MFTLAGGLFEGHLILIAIYIFKLFFVTIPKNFISSKIFLTFRKLAFLYRVRKSISKVRNFFQNFSIICVKMILLIITKEYAVDSAIFFLTKYDFIIRLWYSRRPPASVRVNYRFYQIYKFLLVRRRI